MWLPSLTIGAMEAERKPIVAVRCCFGFARANHFLTKGHSRELFPVLDTCTRCLSIGYLFAVSGVVFQGRPRCLESNAASAPPSLLLCP